MMQKKNIEEVLSAFRTINDAKSVSTQLLCRKMNIDFNKAAELMQTLENIGAVGEFTGNKPRKLLITSEKDFIFKLNK